MRAVKKIIYLANIRLPTEKAHGLQIMKTCEALAASGVEVELVVADRKNNLQQDPFDFYRVKRNFSVTKLPCWDLVSNNYFGAWGFWLQSYAFFRSIKKYLRGHKADWYLTRDLTLANWLPASAAPLAYEIHTLPDRSSARHQRAWQKAAALIVISNGLQAELLHQGLDDKKILVARDAVDVKQFQITDSKEACRAKLGLPLDKKIVVYTGHLYEWKGADLLAKAAALLPADTQVYLVGGTAHDVARFKNNYQARSLHIVGWQEHHLMPYWHRAADLLVLPTSGKNKIGALYTSPLKLFEYIASATPIVAARLPSVQEVLTENQAVFFDPDNELDLREKILGALRQLATWQNRTSQITRQISKECSWANRASLIVNYLNSQKNN